MTLRADNHRNKGTKYNLANQIQGTKEKIHKYGRSLSFTLRKRASPVPKKLSVSEVGTRFTAHRLRLHVSRRAAAAPIHRAEIYQVKATLRKFYDVTHARNADGDVVIVLY